MDCMNAHSTDAAVTAAAAALRPATGLVFQIERHLRSGARCMSMQGRESSDSARSRSPAPSQQLQTEQQREQPEIASAIELTDDQTKAILRVSCCLTCSCNVLLEDVVLTQQCA